jgi:hypothetical protein
MIIDWHMPLVHCPKTVMLSDCCAWIPPDKVNMSPIKSEKDLWKGSMEKLNMVFGFN